jgi:hypothetical protein
MITRKGYESDSSSDSDSGVVPEHKLYHFAVTPDHIKEWFEENQWWVEDLSVDEKLKLCYLFYVYQECEEQSHRSVKAQRLDERLQLVNTLGPLLFPDKSFEYIDTTYVRPTNIHFTNPFFCEDNEEKIKIALADVDDEAISETRDLMLRPITTYGPESLVSIIEAGADLATSAATTAGEGVKEIVKGAVEDITSASKALRKAPTTIAETQTKSLDRPADEQLLNRLKEEFEDYRKRLPNDYRFKSDVEREKANTLLSIISEEYYRLDKISNTLTPELVNGFAKLDIYYKMLQKLQTIIETKNKLSGSNIIVVLDIKAFTNQYHNLIAQLRNKISDMKKMKLENFEKKLSENVDGLKYIREDLLNQFMPIFEGLIDDVTKKLYEDYLPNNYYDKDSENTDVFLLGLQRVVMYQKIKLLTDSRIKIKTEDELYEIVKRLEQIKRLVPIDYYTRYQLENKVIVDYLNNDGSFEKILLPSKDISNIIEFYNEDVKFIRDLNGFLQLIYPIKLSVEPGDKSPITLAKEMDRNVAVNGGDAQEKFLEKIIKPFMKDVLLNLKGEPRDVYNSQMSKYPSYFLMYTDLILNKIKDKKYSVADYINSEPACIEPKGEVLFDSSENIIKKINNYVIATEVVACGGGGIKIYVAEVGDVVKDVSEDVNDAEDVAKDAEDVKDAEDAEDAEDADFDDANEDEVEVEVEVEDDDEDDDYKFYDTEEQEKFVELLETFAGEQKEDRDATLLLFKTLVIVNNKLFNNSLKDIPVFQTESVEDGVTINIATDDSYLYTSYNFPDIAYNKRNPKYLYCKFKVSDLDNFDCIKKLYNSYPQMNRITKLIKPHLSEPQYEELALMLVEYNAKVYQMTKKENEGTDKLTTLKLEVKNLKDQIYTMANKILPLKKQHNKEEKCFENPIEMETDESVVNEINNQLTAFLSPPRKWAVYGHNDKMQLHKNIDTAIVNEVQQLIDKLHTTGIDYHKTLITQSLLLCLGFLKSLQKKPDNSITLEEAINRKFKYKIEYFNDDENDQVTVTLTSSENNAVITHLFNIDKEDRKEQFFTSDYTFWGKSISTNDVQISDISVGLLKYSFKVFLYLVDTPVTRATKDISDISESTLPDPLSSSVRNHKLRKPIILTLVIATLFAVISFTNTTNITNNTTNITNNTSNINTITTDTTYITTNTSNKVIITSNEITQVYNDIVNYLQIDLTLANQIWDYWRKYQPDSIKPYIPILNPLPFDDNMHNDMCNDMCNLVEHFTNTIIIQQAKSPEGYVTLKKIMNDLVAFIGPQTKQPLLVSSGIEENAFKNAMVIFDQRNITNIVSQFILEKNDKVLSLISTCIAITYALLSNPSSLANEVASQGLVEIGYQGLVEILKVLIKLTFGGGAVTDGSKSTKPQMKSKSKKKKKKQVLQAKKTASPIKPKGKRIRGSPKKIRKPRSQDGGFLIETPIVPFNTL